MVKHLRQIPLDTYKPLREVVIENIRDAILSGDFPAGMRLTELQLADEMALISQGVLPSAPGRIRTGDLRITNALLYQLSHGSI